jgi:predicted ribosome quality control (RQC) complex YloA/Tae2 family protein
MTIRWDALLVRELARELDTRLAGHRLRAIRLDGSKRTLVLLFRELTLVWHLHPSRGALLLHPAADPASSDLRLASRVRQVHAPTDERILVVQLLPTRGRQRWDLIVELLGNQWNALVAEGPERRIRHVLVRREGARTLQVGASYSPPAPSKREGSEAPIPLKRWLEVLEPVPPPNRARELVSRIAWTSPVNAAPILDHPGDAGGSLEAGYALWRSLAFERETTAPALLDSRGGRQPYPWALPGVGHEPSETLLDCLASVAFEEAGGGESLGTDVLPPETLAALEGALEDALRRCTRVESELARTGDPMKLRAQGDLLLARLHEVPAAAAEVTLVDFDGGSVTVRLDPRLSAADNASEYYDRASRATRAKQRLPSILSEARIEVRRLEELLARARAGEADAEEIRTALPEVPRRQRSPQPATSSLPYHGYRSSGGLEIRVGRGARFNDALTFRHSAPDDIWLHARHAAGAHVILRWGKTDGPPARDLQEAAILAALNSKSRTSGSVPVDWTRRKYVRKPRGASPGSVVPQRVKTLFVEPDPTLETTLTRLRR